MKANIQRIYLDTSVIGGYFDSDFEEDTHVLFEKVMLGQFHVIVSNVTEDELLAAPQRVRQFLKGIPKKFITRIALTDEAEQLADAYIAENVVGKTSRSDCFHIAMATINKADILVSWNFKHIVNVKRIRGYNSVNLRLGYPMLDIRSPKEIIYNEN